MSILTTAETIINGQRAKDYGDARENHKNIADLWSAWFGWEVKPEDVAICLILLKVARLHQGYHEDSVVDIAGYAGVLEKMQLPKAERYADAIDAEVVEEPKPEPRVWTYPREVPEGVVVVDSNGVRFSTEHRLQGYIIGPVEGDYAQPLGPYTEELVREPRVWQSVLDIPHSTIVLASDGDHLYVTPDGEGWWMGDDPTDFPEDGDGWEFGDRFDGFFAPFTEVLA